MTMAPRSCDYCGKTYSPRRSGQQCCSKACQNWMRAKRRMDGRPARGSVALALVREWSAARRSRIRASLLAEFVESPADAEFGLVALIDQVTSEESR